MIRPTIFPVLFLSMVSVVGADWWAENPDPGTWVTAREKLWDQLQDKIKAQGPTALKPDSPLEHQFRLSQWLEFWGDGGTQKGKEFSELGKNQELIRSFLENLREGDRRESALGLLSEMQAREPRALLELPRLAVALSLVWDEPFPRGWPHSQVRPSSVPRETVDPVSRLAAMAELQARRRFVFDLSDLSVGEMKFLVDHPLPDSEMEWGRKNVTTSRSSWDRVFFGIRYDEERLRKEILIWPYPTYRLADIRERGGICVDQAYFAALAGKARGIPTLFFTGQGDSGGHAWLGYLESPGRWVTDAGKYASENYPVGQAMDPQVWKPMTDTELTFLAKGRERSDGYRQAKLWTDYARKAGQVDGPPFLDAALGLQPEFLAAWEVRAGWLEEKPPEAKREFWNSFVKRFSRFPDLKVAGQEKLLELAKADGDGQAVKNLERQILVQNRTRRFDLSIGVAAARLGEKIEAGDWPAAENAFRQALREFKGQGGGHLFYGLVEPFVKTAWAEGQEKAAKNALQEAKRILRADPSTLVGRALADLEKQLEAPGPSG